MELDIATLFDETIEEPIETDTGTKNQELDLTKGMSARINEVRQKTETETRDKLAKELGYDSYTALTSAREKKMFAEAGLDEDNLEVIDKLVEKRLSEDPRFKKLAELEEREKENFVNSQLQDIRELTGVNYKSVEDLPEETLDAWRKLGNLKQAYLATQGETMLSSSRKNTKSGSLAHLATPTAGPNGTNSRALNSQEKAIYRMVMGNYLTEEELSKKTIEI